MEREIQSHLFPTDLGQEGNQTTNLTDMHWLRYGLERMGGSKGENRRVECSEGTYRTVNAMIQSNQFVNSKWTDITFGLK